MVGVPSGIGQIKRDLGELIGALGIVGGGGSPNELRSDAGVFVGVGVEETLARHVDLLTVETVLVTRIWGASTTSVVTFSFPEDHYLMGLTAFITVTPANLEWLSVVAADPATGVEQLLLFGELTDDRVLLAGTLDIGGTNALSVMVPPLLADFPRFAPAITDYTYQVRGNALGGGTARLVATVARCPKGVEIPH